MGSVMVGYTEEYPSRLRRAPHEFPSCGKDAMFLYTSTEYVCGIPKTRFKMHLGDA